VKYSDVPKLSRNDSIILGQQVDVGKALDLLAIFKEAGKGVQPPGDVSSLATVPKGSHANRP